MAHGERLGQLAAAIMVGTAVEYYDFFIYISVAALIFGPLFFLELSAAAEDARVRGHGDLPNDADPIACRAAGVRRSQGGTGLTPSHTLIAACPCE